MPNMEIIFTQTTITVFEASETKHSLSLDTSLLDDQMWAVENNNNIGGFVWKMSLFQTVNW
jgi:hypothetical protein